MSTTAFARRLADTALTQYTKFHLLREQEPVLAAQIKKYWDATGVAFPGVSVAWSAVFVSWCVKTAGATNAEFTFNPQHSVFVFDAIQNQLNNRGVFRGRTLTDYTPKVGDILHNNRSGNTFDYAYATIHNSYFSHSAIVIEVGTDSRGRYLQTVGGNEGDSVGRKEVRLTPLGFVRNPTGIYISIIENLK